MRIVHLADTHLGYSAYRKVTEQGVNQREMDVYDAFTRCIDYVVQSQPDLVVHAGDLFDSVRPTNRAITVAVQQILRVSKEQIPFVVISGNHETPKLKETGNIFTIFEHLDHVYPVHRNQYEKISLKQRDETVCIHAIPQCQTPDEFSVNIKKISVDKKADYNLLLAHGAVKGIKEFKMNEFNELFIPVKNLSEDFDYIALGHYHLHTKLQQNAYYSGSTERLSFTEADSQKGCVEIQLGKKIKHRFVPLQTRTMIDAPSLDCSSLRVEQIMQHVKEFMQGIEPKDKIIRLRLVNIPLHVQRGIDYHQIRELGKTALHFEVKPVPLKTDTSVAAEGYKMRSLADEFEKFLSTQQYPEAPMLRALGLQYIQKAEEQEKKP
jgi:DNA repair protein SbcD/Mre11